MKRIAGYMLAALVCLSASARSQDHSSPAFDMSYIMPNELPGIGHPSFSLGDAELIDTIGALPPIGIVQIAPDAGDNLHSIIGKAGLTPNISSQVLMEMMNPGISWDDLSGVETIYVPQFNDGFWEEITRGEAVTIYDEFDRGILKNQVEVISSIRNDILEGVEFYRVPKDQVDLTIYAIDAATSTVDAILSSSEVPASFASIVSQDTLIIEGFAQQLLQDLPLDQGQVEALQFVAADLGEQGDQVASAPSFGARTVTVRVVNSNGAEIDGLRVWFSAAAYHRIGKHLENSMALWQLSSPAQGPVERVGHIIFWATDALGQRVLTSYQEIILDSSMPVNPPDIVLSLIEN